MNGSVLTPASGVSASSPTYFVAADVFPCVTDDCTVILSLSRDQYIALAPTKSDQLVGHVQGWPSSESRCQDPTGGAPLELLAEMVMAGLLTTDRALGRDGRPVSVDRAEFALLEPDLDARPRVFTRDYAYLMVAYAVAVFMLRFRRFDRIFQRIRKRKERRGPTAPDIDALRRPTAAFIHVRPLLFSARRKCLLDSVTLLEFLALHGLFPDLVIGVQTGPHAAHCWVQVASTVCNDTPDNVRRFTPILVT